MASTTTTYGYKKPTNGDKVTWWVDLNANTDRVDAHTHNGVDSALLPAKNLSRGSSVLVAASWVATAGQAGTYEQTVTVPVGYDMATVTMSFYINSGATLGNLFFPSISRLSATTYKIYINDNTVDVKVLYA